MIVFYGLLKCDLQLYIHFFFLYNIVGLLKIIIAFKLTQVVLKMH